MKVKFLPQNIELEIGANQTIMDLAHKNGLPIKSICGGNASCAECRIKVSEGEQNLSLPGQKELSLIGTGYFIDQRRLSCQLRCFGDVVIDLNDQIEKQKQAPKKVLGNRKMDLEKSHAVSEMLITKNEEIKELAEDKPQVRADKNPKRHSGRGFRYEPGNNNNNSNRPKR
jgi:2Fe-2S ferredoxin